MAENTKIEWADHTFNPWTGCTKVSPACDHCYAEGWAKRSGHVKWGSGLPLAAGPVDLVVGGLDYLITHYKIFLDIV